ncbi:MAG TPA: response regulator [Bacteroidetes bacterium]|nr:response regulator [Bacteroidota bacterium]
MDKRRILFVDDETEILEILADLFADSTVEVETAKTGRQALQKCQEHKIDAILCDLKLPDMSGLEVLKIVRTRWPKVKRFLTTGYFDPLQSDCLQQNRLIDKFFPKPWDVLELRQYVEKSLEEIGDKDNGS